MNNPCWGLVGLGSSGTGISRARIELGLGPVDSGFWCGEEDLGVSRVVYVYSIMSSVLE